ncbi:MAG: hypothetical protein ACJAUH_003288 [Saprospiraceae bacterium]|jgi:hypothetical protein
MLIPCIYILRLDHVLYLKRWKKRIDVITSGLIISGGVLLLFSILNPFLLVVSISFLFPKYHVWLYRVLRRFFVEKMSREPVDVRFNFKSGFTEDRIFAIFFTLFSIFSTALVWVPLVKFLSNI